MQKTYKSEGFVLKKRVMLGKDMLVTIFSRDQGKIACLAKGVKKITSKRLASLETGNLIRFIAQARNDRLYLADAQLLSLLSRIKVHEGKVKTYYFFLFILDRLLPDGVREDAVYRLMQQIVIHLSKQEMGRKDVAPFITQLLTILGYGVKAKTWEELLDQLQDIIGQKIPPFVI